MSDEIDGIAKECFPSCTCVLYSEKLPQVGFNSQVMYFYEYNKSIRYEDIKKISYGNEVKIYFIAITEYGLRTKSVSLGSMSYQMALFFDIISGNNLLKGRRKNELLDIHLQSCNNRTVRDIIS